jgi:hypothetical protein
MRQSEYVEDVREPPLLIRSQNAWNIRAPFDSDTCGRLLSRLREDASYLNLDGVGSDPAFFSGY